MTGSSFYSVEKIEGGRSGGATQAETRIYNERLVLSLIRRHGALSKVELTKLTGLSAQATTTIVNRLAKAQLLLRGEPIRGRLGQPAVPYSLNPDGAFGFGLKIDRRSADVALVNLSGQHVAFERTTYDYPTPDGVLHFAREAITQMRHMKSAPPAEKIAGIGIASPYQLWGWADKLGVRPEELAGWKRVDVRRELEAEFDWPAYLFNDGMVSAAAELMFGMESGRSDFLYAYIGFFIGGGLVLDHHLFPGRNREAGALGFFQVPATDSVHSSSVPLMDVASLISLVEKVGRDSQTQIWTSPEHWDDLGPSLEDWIVQSSNALTEAVLGAVPLLDVDSIIIDGAMPESVRKEVAKRVRKKLVGKLDYRKEPFSVLEGTFGHLAPAVGAASIPLMVRYSTDKDILFKE
ncbi:MAG: ROK family transcriptional regulator [Pseudomonadota bacterium]